MSQVGEGEVVVFPTFRGFRTSVVSEVDKTGREAGGKLASTIGGALKGIGTAVAVGVGAAIAGVAAIAGKGISRALNIQDARAKLTGLGHDAASVETIMTSALDSVRGTAFGMDAAAQIAASSVAAGIAPGEALTRTLKLTADAATIGKASLSEMGDMVNKVATNGKLTTEVLQQFQGRGIPLLQLLATQYGVTAEAAAEMVTKGEVDFASFQNALEAGVGGAALSSGATARGAWANVGAAWARLGAMFTGSAVDGAPTLFTSIAAAVDRLSAALAPVAEGFNGKLTPAIATLSAWIDGIDFNAVVAGVEGAITTAVTKIATAFEFVKGAFNTVVAAFQSGDFSSIGSSFGDIGAVMQPMLPIFLAVGKGIGGIAVTVGDLIAAGIPLLVPILQSFTDILGFLGDHSEILTPLIVGLGAGFLIYKSATVAATAVSIAAIPIELARTAAMLASAGANNRLAAATLTAAGADKASLASKLPATGAVLVNTAAMIGNAIAAAAVKTAQVAGAVATGIATAAQWAFNAAMSANPIALVILAIVALVAGLVWFFTQTELGKAIWTNFTGFLVEAWNNILAVASAVFGALGLYFSTTWNSIVGGFQAAIAFIVDLFLHWTPLGILINNFGAIVEFFSTMWSNITGVVSTGVSNVVRFFTELPGKAMAALGNMGALALDAGRSLIQGFIDGIKGMIGNVGKAIGGVMDFVAGFFPHSPAKRGPFSGSGWTAVKSAGLAIGDQFGDGLDAASPSLTARFNSLLSVAGTRPGSSGGTAAQTATAASPQVLHLYDVDGVLMGAFAVAADSRIAAADTRDSMVTGGRRKAF
jgi:tape measure domain-containing protein